MRRVRLLTKYLYKAGAVAAEDMEVVQYGLETFVENMFGLGTIVFIGGCFGHLLSSFILWLLIFPLRKFAGGFHAKTRINCTLLSISMLLFTFAIFIAKEWSVFTYSMIMLVMFGIVYVMAPIDTPNKRLDWREYQVYRRQTRGILVVEGGLFVLAVVLRVEVLYTAVVMCFFIVAVSLVAGKIDNHVKNIRN